MEARVGIEPTDRSFADSGLTTWLPRPPRAESSAKTNIKKLTSSFYIKSYFCEKEARPLKISVIT